MGIKEWQEMFPPHPEHSIPVFCTGSYGADSVDEWM